MTSQLRSSSCKTIANAYVVEVLSVDCSLLTQVRQVDAQQRVRAHLCHEISHCEFVEARHVDHSDLVSVE